MAEFTSAAQFATVLQQLQRDLQRQTADATLDMARRAERHLEAAARSDLGGDTQFSGWPGRDLADMRIKQARSRDGHWLFPTRKSGGPWKVAEQGRNQGNATGRGGTAIFSGPGLNRQTGETSFTSTGRVRMRRFARRRWNGYTAGKGTASRTLPRIERDAEQIAERMMRTAITRRLDTP